jgi:hypothetical protein
MYLVFSQGHFKIFARYDRHQTQEGANMFNGRMLKYLGIACSVVTTSIKMQGFSLGMSSGLFSAIPKIISGDRATKMPGTDLTQN